MTLTEREEISRFLAEGWSLRGIASKLGRAPSTISREMARGLGHAHSHKDSVTGKLQPIIHRDISPESVKPEEKSA